MNIRLHRVVGWLLVTVLTPGLANAYELLTENGVCPNGIRWTSDQHISVNISNAGAQALELSVAVSDVATRVSNVGGQWFDYLLPYGVDTSAYQLLVKGSPDGDGINEIGLADLSAFGTNVLGMGPTDVDATNCTINEGDVFLDSVVKHGTHGCNYLLTVNLEMDPLDGFISRATRDSRGTMLSSISRRLGPRSTLRLATPVILPPGCA